MTHSVHTKILIFARLFTACAALLLLTITVMPRDDADGYQAVHLFFMPRQNWEMGQGVGMLHDASYYQSVNSAALAAESADVEYPPNLRTSASASDLQATDGYLIRSDSTAQQPFLGKMRPILNLSGATLSVGQTDAYYVLGATQSFVLLLAVIPLTMWVGDTPTPPPRRGGVA
jgi:hypothetical protein